MKIPPDYEEMVRDVIKAASKHRFLYQHDTLKSSTDFDHNGEALLTRHTHTVWVCLERVEEEITEDAPEII